MSLAGNPSLIKSIRSLFRKKEQAPSSASVQPEGRQRALALPPEEFRRIDAAFERWVQEKGYRMPDVTIKETASRMGCKGAQLHRYCIQKMGVDFRTWRVRQRIEDAKVLLLQEPDTSASHIGRMVGIQDRSNFLRQFERLTGLSPEQWRQNELASR